MDPVVNQVSIYHGLNDTTLLKQNTNLSLRVN